MSDPVLTEGTETQVDRMTNICRQTAKILTGKIWENLPYPERLLVAMLERGRFLCPLEDGLVGKVFTEVVHISQDLDTDFTDHPNVGRQCG